LEHLKAASLEQALALLTNITYGWKVLPGTNTSLLQTLVNYGRKNLPLNAANEPRRKMVIMEINKLTLASTSDIKKVR
jgi:hypothetical protein